MQALDQRLPRSLVMEDRLNLRHYAGIVNRHKWWIGLITLLATLAAIWYCFAVQPVFRSTATLLVESKEANIVSIQNVYGVDTQSTEYFDTQFEILRSRKLADRVISELGLQEQLLADRQSSWLDRWLSPDAPPTEEGAPTNNTAAVVTYVKNLTVTPIPKTQLVRVSFDSPDPELAAKVANRHVNAFIQSNLDARDKVNQGATAWMSKRLEELRRNLEESERKLQTYKEQEKLVDIAGIQTLSAQSLEDLSAKLADLRRQTAASRNAYDQVNRAKNGGLNALLSVPAIKVDLLVQQFKQARAQAQLKVAELAKRYGPDHPKMKAARSELAAAELELSQHVGSVTDAIRNEYEINQAQVNTIASSVEGAKTDMHKVGRKEAGFRILQREVETNRQLFDLFYNRIREMTETNDLVAPNARVIDPAEIPLEPLKPQKALIISMAFLVSLIGGLMAAFFYELVNDKVKHPGDVDEKIGLPLLGYLPAVRPGRWRRPPVSRRFGHKKEAEFSEMIRTVRTGIMLSGLDQKRKVLMVTSTVSGEGKTAVVCNLALAFAQIEKVLLIDTDMRRPAIAKEFGLGTRPGLSDLMAGTASVADCIVAQEDSELHILPAGKPPPNPLELLGSAKFASLLQNLSTQYDKILLDCPPVLPVSDPLVLAKRADGLIYVIKADSTSIARVKAGFRQLSRVPVPIAGIVLNHLDVKKASQYGDYGSVGYYTAYTEN